VEFLSEQINEIIKKHHSNIKNDLDKLFNDGELINKKNLDKIKELTSARYYSNDFLRIKDNEQETSTTLALEFFFYDDAQIEKALETGMFDDDNHCE
jgi:hypothetical protein